MKISEDTARVVAFLQETTAGNLRKPNDMETLLELGATYGAHTEINELVFAGSALWLVSKKLKSIESNDQGAEKLAEEYLRNMNNINILLQFFSSIAPADIQKRFAEIYLSEDRGAALNIIDLSHDLFALKEIQNKLKREQKVK